jgi:hypothetical protein
MAIGDIRHFNDTDYEIVAEIRLNQTAYAQKEICIERLRDIHSGEEEVRFGYFINGHWIQDTLMCPFEDFQAIQNSLSLPEWQ